MRVLLGCGDSPRQDWLNIDETSWFADEHAQPWLLPIETLSVDEIETCDIFSRYPAHYRERIFKECARILKPGAILTISEPNFQAIAEQFVISKDADERSAAIAQMWNDNVRTACTLDMLVHPLFEHVESIANKKRLKVILKRKPIPTVGAVILAGHESDIIGKRVRDIKPYVDKCYVALWNADDETRRIAYEEADEVIELKLGANLEANHVTCAYNAAYDAMNEDYILSLDSDEEICHPEEIKRVLAEETDDMYILARFDVIDGRRVTVHPFSFRDEQPRFFRRDKFRFKDFHAHASQQPIVEGTTAQQLVKMWIWHQRSSERFLASQKQWVDLEPEDKKAHTNNMQQFSARRVREITERKESGEKYRILLTYFGVVGIGDHLMTLPAVKKLRQLYPDAIIDYNTKRPEALEGLEYIDNIITDELNYEDRCWYDLILGWETSLTGEPGKRFDGYDLCGWWIGVDLETIKPDWIINRKDAKYAERLASSCKAKGAMLGLELDSNADKLIGIVLSASCLHRTWPFIEEFCLKFLETHPRYKIVFFGPPGTEMLELHIKRQRRLFGVERVKLKTDVVTEYYTDFPGHDRVVRLAGQLGLRQEAALYPHMELMIVPDTGPLHIACALNVPTVSYFSVAHPETRITHFDNVTALMVDYPCAPCFKWGSIVCEKTTDLGAPCLRTITVDKMMNAVNARLAAGR